MYRIPVAIFKDDNNPNYGAVIPDVPGCYPCGDSIEETIEDSRKMIVEYMEYIIEEKVQFELKITDISVLRTNSDYDGAIWAIVEIDEALISDNPIRFNASFPEYLLAQIDKEAKSLHETRSGFLAKAAMLRLNRSVNSGQ